MKDRFLTKYSGILAVIAAILALLVVWYIDHISWHGLNLIMFYIVPIFIASWFAGGFAGVCVSLCAAIVWSFDNLVVSNTFFNPVVPYLNLVATFIFFLVVTLVVRRIRYTLIMEEKYGNSDFLTKTANSRFFHDVARLEINRARRSKRAFSILYFDLDNFKSVNDNFGHSSGDLLLKKVADAVKLNIRQVDILARMGGDEFAVLMPDTDFSGSELAAMRIQESIKRLAQERDWPISASIGLVTCIQPPGSSDEMIKWADEVMFRAKNKGKNMIIHEECKK